MKAVLLSIHVLAAVILIGPITVAASLFPRYARAAVDSEVPAQSVGLSVAAAMHRVTRGYAYPAVAVPVFGISLAGSMHVLSQSWLVVSMILTGLAAVVLVTRIVPTQTRLLKLLGSADAAADATVRRLRSLAMQTGLFGTLWAIVVVLMITRPGSSTGV